MRERRTGFQPAVTVGQISNLSGQIEHPSYGGNRITATAVVSTNPFLSSRMAYEKSEPRGLSPRLNSISDSHSAEGINPSARFSCFHEAVIARIPTPPLAAAPVGNSRLGRRNAAVGKQGSRRHRQAGEFDRHRAISASGAISSITLFGCWTTFDSAALASVGIGEIDSSAYFDHGCFSTVGFLRVRFGLTGVRPAAGARSLCVILGSGRSTVGGSR